MRQYSEEIIKNWDCDLELSKMSDWDNYYWEYTSTVETLIENYNVADDVVLPLLFLMRHTLELAFKMNLIRLEKLSEENAKLNFKGKSGHSLGGLHSEFERQLQIIFAKHKINMDLQSEFLYANTILKEYADIFNRLDNWSYAFRYPVQNDGSTNNFKDSSNLNIADLIPTFKKTQLILEQTFNLFWLCEQTFVLLINIYGYRQLSVPNANYW